jgi:hypothetical protein
MMSNLVFVTGDFCSGSTLLFTLFRKTRSYYCIYEPLHEDLIEYMIWPMLPDDHHFFVESYYAELKGFDRVPELFNPEWGRRNFYLPADAQEDELYRYVAYLIGTAFGRGPRIMIKENRFTFRIAWLRAKFPDAKVVHIYRKKEAQWNSNLRRVQSDQRREDVGQDSVHYNGFAVASWCEDLKSTFPELHASHFNTGYERFCKLWELCYEYNKKYADISIDYGDLTGNFEPTCERIWQAIGATGIDTTALKQFMIPPEKQKSRMIRSTSVAQRANLLIDRLGRKYSHARAEVLLRRRAVNQEGK